MQKHYKAHCYYNVLANYNQYSTENEKDPIAGWIKGSIYFDSKEKKMEPTSRWIINFEIIDQGPWQD
jgi:hypothetical protein